MTRPGLVLKPQIKPFVGHEGKRRGWGGGSMTRGGRSRGIEGGSNGVGGCRTGDMTRKGFESTETHDDTGLQTPQKKNSKKISGSNFFFQEKIFCGFGGFLVIMGFYLKPNPCHRFLEPGPNPCHHGFLVTWTPPGVTKGFRKGLIQNPRPSAKSPRARFTPPNLAPTPSAPSGLPCPSRRSSTPPTRPSMMPPSDPWSSPSGRRSSSRARISKP